MSTQTLQQQFDALKAENEALKINNAKLEKAKPSGGIKVSAKGAVSVYGLGRFPVTLYKSQWESLLGMAPKIAEFIKANNSQLKEKE